MEAQIPQDKPGPNGTPGGFPSPSPTAVYGGGGGVGRVPSSPGRVVGILLHGLAIILTLVATILMGVAKQSKTVEVTDDYSQNTDYVKVMVKSTYFSAYVYFIAANAIAFFLSTVSFVLTIINTGKSSMNLLSIIKVVTIVLLFSCNGAALAIHMVTEHGVDKVGYDKFCNLASSFCSKVTAAIVLSMKASLAHVLLLLLSIINRS